MRLFSPSRILRAASKGSTVDWSKTLHLPKSTFPARPSAARIDEYRKRCADDLYSWQLANRPKTAKTDAGETGNEFILHDGPPYANGAVHVGHALNKILKDLILRTELASGKRIQYQPGWDCHGLPIELKALQQRKAPAKQARSLKDAPDAEAGAAALGAGMSDEEIRKAARTLATQTVEDQKLEFRSWAVMGEWDKPYKTMDRDFEVRQLRVFKEMVKNDLIFRAYRPVYWSPSSRTALAEAELEYDDRHKCTAAFIKMQITKLPNVLHQTVGASGESVHAIIWTTTPWTLPANQAIAVNNDMIYSLMRLHDGDQQPTEGLYLIAQERIHHVQSFLPEGWHFNPVVEEILGSQLAADGALCRNPFSGNSSPILSAGFVTSTSGTGLVHLAPGHGMEDYQLCQQNGITSAFAPVDDAGCYTADVFPLAKDKRLLPGLDVQTKGTKAVLDILSSPLEHFSTNAYVQTSSLVVAAHEFVHKNPIDWRTKRPVIVRSTAQWFTNLSHINRNAVAALDDVAFIPSSGRNRLRAFIEGRSQWCISRQRAWGVPIPVLYHKETDAECYTNVVIEHIISTYQRRGADAWFSDPPDDPAWIHPSLEQDKWVRKRDTMDVWFDSGTSWTSLPIRNNQQISDVCVEGSDQHRGWFQSSLLTRIATEASGESRTLAPYKKLVTHGFTLDGEGRKMSKSLGNVIPPSAITSGSILSAPSNQYKAASSGKKRKQDPLGSDLLRLWVAASDYTKDVSVSQQSIQGLQQSLSKYRVTFRFLFGVLQDAHHHEQNERITPLEEFAMSDQMILTRLSQRSKAIFEAYREYRFYEGVREMNNFVNGDLSAFYFETIKDTMYAGLQSDRRRVQTVLYLILRELLQWLAPVTPQLVEEAWEHMPQQLKSNDDSHSVARLSHPLRNIWQRPFPPWSDDAIESVAQATAFFEPLSKAAKTAQEKARMAGKLGSGLACRVEVRWPEALGHVWTAINAEHLREALVVSELTFKGISAAGDSGSSPLEDSWHYEEPFELKLNGSSEVSIGNVVVRAPSKQKCPRCWQYTSDHEEDLCGRCEIAAKETEKEASPS